MNEVAPVLMSDEIDIVESLRTARARIVECQTIDPNTKLAMVRACNEVVNQLFSLAVLRMKDGVHYVLHASGTIENAVSRIDDQTRPMTIAEMKKANEVKIFAARDRKDSNAVGAASPEEATPRPSSETSSENLAPVLPRDSDRPEVGPVAS